MKQRSMVLAALALALLSWNASAQGRGVRGTAGGKGATNYGSVERTRLLSQAGGRSSRKGDEALVYGGVERRAALNGVKVHMPLPQSLQPKPRYPHASPNGRRR